MLDSNASKVKVRRSVRDLQSEYDRGNKKPLEDLVRAWKGIQELPPSDPQSFFALGGLHGEPFQYRKAVDELDATDTYTYWGGFCNHGNVLFPTWHRVYVFKLEEALQCIVPGVAMPYWDETDDFTLQHGIPSILTQETFPLDGEVIRNPLQCFVLPRGLSDMMPGDQRDYEKPPGYETVRYPLSGLVGTPQARAQTDKHNAQYPNHADNVGLLNENVRAWLYGRHPTPENPNPTVDGVYAQFQQCLEAPNYTVFSNGTSSSQWNLINPGKVTPLESPHDDLHLAVGGFDVPNQGEYGQVAGANGDMGENNTAGMDPIFFFHHCNIDRMFWLWQKRHGQTDQLDIIKNFAGTSASDSQGPTPGIAPGTPLSLQTQLNPFKQANGEAFTSADCVNIERQLGYTYAPGSFDRPVATSDGLADSVERAAEGKKLHVSGINRSEFQGSFILTAYATLTDEQGKLTTRYLGHKSVLSRYNVVRCANCLTHIEVMAHFPLLSLSDGEAANATFHVELQHRAGRVYLTDRLARTQVLSAAGSAPTKPAEIRLID
jgi:tyrosinase